MSSRPFAVSATMYRAGAGAGKTHTLVHKIFDLCLEHRAQQKKYPRLVCCTFTRKATQELRERLVSLAYEKNETELAHYFATGEGVLVTTIHGVCSAFLNQYGTLLELDPGFQVINENQEETLAKRILRDLVQEDQAWSGLTDELGMDSIVWALRHFDEKIRENDRIQPFSESDFYSYLEEKLKVIDHHLEQTIRSLSSEELSSDWAQMSDQLRHLQGQLLKSNTQEKINLYVGLGQFRWPRIQTGKKIHLNSPASDEVKNFRELLEIFEDSSWNPQYWPRLIQASSTFAQLGQRFSEEIQASKRKRGWVSYSDLEILALQLTEQSAEATSAFSKYWDYWLVDEYQDTSPLQEKILFKLIGSSSYFLVGDPQQSIYFFRGARTQVFLEKEKEVLSSQGAVNTLGDNWRSTPELVSFFNDLFLKYKRGFISMNPRKTTSPQFKDQSVSILRAADEAAELDQICWHVRDLLTKGERPEEIAILARQHAVLDWVAEGFFKNNIPVQQHALGAFHKRREITDSISLLRFLLNPHDNTNLIRILRAPWFRVEDDKILKGLANKKGPLSHWESLRSLDEEGLQRLQQARADLPVKGLVETWKDMLFKTGIIELSHVYDSSGTREANLWKLIRQVEAYAHDSQSDFWAWTRERLEEGVSEDGEAVSALEPNRVQLMTIHHSKGLQFKHVIIPRLQKKLRAPPRADVLYVDEQNLKWGLRLKTDDGKSLRAPNYEFLKNWQEINEQEESLRVFYVGVTRAKETLLLSSNGDAENGSWLQGLPIDIEMGRHQGEGYSYWVTEDLQQQQEAPGPVPIAGVTAVRKPFQTEFKTRTSVSVTNRLEKKEITSKEALKSIVKAAGRGTWAHRLFESMKYDWNLDPTWDQGEDKKALQYLRTQAQIPLRQILESGQVEWGFNMRLESGEQIPGQIDVWGKVQDTIWVLDYKTGRATDMETAFRQLSTYAFALQRMGEKGKYKAAVVLPFEERIVIRELSNDIPVDEILKPKG